jgi:hypothetical protein
MMQRQRSSTTVDIQCAQCGKPMLMLSFNYTTLERGFESISLRCQYCKAEETRPWPRPTADEDSALEVASDEAQQATLGETPQAIPDETEPPAQSSNEAVEVDTLEASESVDDTREPSDETPAPDAPTSSSDLFGSADDYERLRLRFARRPAPPSEAPET